MLFPPFSVRLKRTAGIVFTSFSAREISSSLPFFCIGGEIDSNFFFPSPLTDGSNVGPVPFFFIYFSLRRWFLLLFFKSTHLRSFLPLAVPKRNMHRRIAFSHGCSPFPQSFSM